MSRRSAHSAVSILAVVFLALHIPYIPASLEDVDSINFALGVRHFDVAMHQPHPPGYPVFIAAARGARRLATSEAAALSGLSVLSGALGVLAIAALFRRLSGATDRSLWPIVGALIAMTSPLYWFTAARPLSDSMGLAAAVGVQALILASASPRALALTAFLAGLAIGIRSQVLWLTVPLLVYRAFGLRAFKPAIPAFVTGSLAWFVPLVILSGGPSAYWRALFDQGAEDLSGIRMLWTSPTPRALADALYYAGIAPWADWMLAVVVLALALMGAAVLMRRDRRALSLLALAFGPYFVFDILFQETFTVRYALPLIVPVAFLAMSAVGAFPQPLGLIASAPVIMFGAHIGGRSIAAYSRQPAPAFRLLEDMRHESEARPARPVLAPDRRQSFDLRRPLKWMGDAAPAFAQQLAAPPQHEWLEAVKYWNGGGRAPIWFVVDPRRAAIDLVQHGDPRSYRWSVPYPVLMSGTRPNDSDWYSIERPDWYVGEGWALTPEAAGVAEAGGSGLTAAAIRGWVSREALERGALVLGGRNFEPALRPQLTASVGARVVLVQALEPGSFLRVVRLPEDFAPTAGDYEPVEIRSDPPARVAVEQWDVSRTRGVLGFGDGWFEHELNPETGRQWRWLGERGEVRYATAGPGAVLRLTGESPLNYYARPSRVIVRAGGTVLRDQMVSSDFTVEVPLPAAIEPSTITIETDQTHVPADRRWRRSADRRRLGLRIYSCVLLPLTPASAPGTATSSRPAR